MSAEHRKPVAAFVLLALMAAGVIGIQRAEAQAGRLLVAVIGAGAEVHGTLPAVSETTRAVSLARSSRLGPAFVALAAMAAAPDAASDAAPDAAPVADVPGRRPVTGATGEEASSPTTTRAPRPVTGARGTGRAADRAPDRAADRAADGAPGRAGDRRTRRGGGPDDTRPTHTGPARSQVPRPADPLPARGRREAAHRAAVGRQTVTRPAAAPRRPAHAAVSTPGPSNGLGRSWLPPGQQARHN